MAKTWSGQMCKFFIQLTNFLCTKKQGQGLRVVEDFQELNNQLHINKYSMKDITKCIGDIGRANSTIFFYTGPHIWNLANAN